EGSRDCLLRARLPEPAPRACRRQHVEGGPPGAHRPHHALPVDGEARAQPQRPHRVARMPLSESAARRLEEATAGLAGDWRRFATDAVSAAEVESAAADLSGWVRDGASPEAVLTSAASATPLH